MRQTARYEVVGFGCEADVLFLLLLFCCLSFPFFVFPVLFSDVFPANFLLGFPLYVREPPVVDNGTEQRKRGVWRKAVQGWVNPLRGRLV